MTDQELESILAGGEADRVERKQSVSDPGDIRQAICAFANDLPNHRLPGVVFIGIKDHGDCANLPITDQLLRQLADMRSDGNILPFPNLLVQKRNLRGCEVAVVIVHPSDSPPTRFNGRCWIRVGSRRATATVSEEARLAEKRRFRDVPFDLRPMESASIGDLDLELFERRYAPASVAPEVLEQNQRSTEHRLSSLRLATSTVPPIPTVLGCLVCGKEPTQFIPGAYIQFLRIDGVTLTSPIKDQELISGPMLDLLSKLDLKLEAHLSTATDITSQATEVVSPDYPLAALQQITRNAVLHRSYESPNAPIRITWFNDRIEVMNPGGPFGNVTADNFGQPGVRDYRNPHLAEAMRNLGYVQKFGMGIQIAREQMKRNGNPDPVFTVESNHVLVELRKKS
jgi:ATP-dependent DNA helicase RecG